MIKILFICHGNICRSPMAEFIMKNLVTKSHLADCFYIASAATSSEEIWNGIGNPVYPPAKAELAKHGISCEGKRAVQLTRADYEKYDYLIGMDSANMRNMQRLFGTYLQNETKPTVKKLYKLSFFAGSDKDVADPWYTGNFRETYDDVLAGCEGLLRFLIENERV